MNRTRYLVAGMQRSGTTVTYLCVRGHPNATGLNDEINVRPFFDKGIAAFTNGAETKLERERGHRVLFDALASIAADERTTACGMKTALATVDEVEILGTCLREHLADVKLVLTVREDWVAQFGSLIRAQKTGMWHSWVKPKQAGLDSFEIDPALFAEYAIACRDVIGRLRQLSTSHDLLEISYERQILDGAPASLLPVFDFLSLPRTEITWVSSTKVAPPPEQFITNVGALRRIEDRVRDGAPLAAFGRSPGLAAFMKQIFGA